MADLNTFTGILFRGLRESYLPESAHKGKVYFATDTKEVLIDNISYGGAGIEDVSIDGTTLTIQTSTGEVSVDISDIIKYNTTIDDSLAMPSAVGGIAKGTTAGTLKAKTFTQLFDDLLFPTIQPVGTAPSVAFSVKSAQLEVGAELPTELADFNYTFTRGIWKLNGVTVSGKYYSGTAGTPTIKCNYPAANSNPPASVDTDAAITYTLSVTVAKGDTTVDNKGNAATVQPYAGGTITKTATINTYYSYYSNASANATVAKGKLLTATNVTDLAFAPETAASKKHQFKLPNKYNLTAIYQKNTIGNTYDGQPNIISDFTKTTETINVNGVDVEYATYTRNDAGFIGAATYKFVFTK